MMKNIKQCVLFSVASLALYAAGVCAEDIYVITHPSVSLSADDIRDVFVGEKQTAGGTKLIPVNNGSAKTVFLEKVIHVDAAKFESIWTKKAFRDGLTAPATKGSDMEVISSVKGTPGVVGYVSKAPSADVKVIKKF
jgi:hypothetical protein